MKKCITIIFILLYSTSFSTVDATCKKSDTNYNTTYNELTKLEKEKYDTFLLLEEKREKLKDAQAKIEKKYPSGSYSFVKKMLDKDYASLIEDIDELTLNWKVQQHNFTLLKSDLKNYANTYNECAENENKKSISVLNTYINDGNQAFNNGNYLEAISQYKKAKKLSSSKTIRENLAQAYFLYANGRFYKGNENEAIKYYELALQEGYGDLYGIYLNIGLSYDSLSIENYTDIKLLNTILSYYKKALSSTSNLEEINKVKELIQQTNNRLASQNKIKVEKAEPKSEPKENNKIINKTQEQKVEKNNDELIEKANKVLDRINEKTLNFSFERKVVLYKKYIAVLEKYSSETAKGDIKIMVNLIIKGMKSKVDNNFEITIQDILGL